MDPVTIATATATTAQTVWVVGNKLYDLIQSTNVVNETVRNLTSEVDQLSKVCKAVKGQLEILGKQYATESTFSTELERREDAPLWDGIKAQLSECDRAMRKLDTALSSVRKDGSSFLAQTFRQLKLDMSKEEISESRIQIRAHTSNLQISLQLVAIKAAHIVPRIANQDLLAKMTELQATVEAVGQKVDNNLAQSAKDVLSSGATLYQASVANGSVMGDPGGLEHDMKTLEWLKRIDLLQLEDSTADDATARSGNHSVFSTPNDTSTLFTDSLSTSGGVPLETRKDDAGSVRNGIEDDEQDFELDIEDEITLEAANTTLDSGVSAFGNADYQAADSDLQETLLLIQELPEHLRHKFDMLDLRFKLAVCSFHVHSAYDAEAALLSVVSDSTRSRMEAVNLCHAGHLLAQVYIKLTKLDQARMSCENTLRARWRLLGKQDRSCHESLAVLSKIYDLLGNTRRAKTYLNMIPGSLQESLLQALAPISPSPIASNMTCPITVPSQSSQPLYQVDATVGAPLLTLKGHSGIVCSVAFSPDGRKLASASTDNTVQTWDATTGAPLQTLEGHLGSVCSVAFSPDGRKLASGSEDKTVKTWDATTGAPLQTLEGHLGTVCSVAFSPDGRKLASGSGDKTVKTWDATTGAPLQTLKGHLGYVWSVAFSPDGRKLASGSEDKTVKTWDATTGAPLQTLNGHLNYVRSVAFSPHGRWLASGSGDKTVKTWDATTGAPLQTLEGHLGSVCSVAFSPDGRKLASASNDKTVQTWDATTGAPLQTLEGHLGTVCSVAFSPDGRKLASGSGDKTVKTWDATTGAPLQTFNGHLNYVRSVAFSPDGRKLASGSFDYRVKTWNLEGGAIE